MSTEIRWVRAKDGAIAGVCKGLAKSLDLDLNFLRLAWLVSLLFAGCGFWAYIILAIALPREDKLTEATNPKLLGVCVRLSRRLELEVGVVRALAIISAFLSMGASIVAYIILRFVIPETESSKVETN